MAISGGRVTNPVGRSLQYRTQLTSVSADSVFCLVWCFNTLQRYFVMLSFARGWCWLQPRRMCPKRKKAMYHWRSYLSSAWMPLPHWIPYWLGLTAAQRCPKKKDWAFGKHWGRVPNRSAYSISEDWNITSVYSCLYSSSLVRVAPKTV